jgi:hypothetical protein
LPDDSSRITARSSGADPDALVMVRAYNLVA